MAFTSPHRSNVVPRAAEAESRKAPARKNATQPLNTDHPFGNEPYKHSRDAKVISRECKKLNLYSLAHLSQICITLPRMSTHEEPLPTNNILIVGGGPIGLLLATVLSHHGIRSILLERNETTTKWPKMDLTNARSMEMLRRLGLSEEMRLLGVPSDKSHNVLVSSGLAAEECVTKWELPSVDEFRRKIQQKTMGLCRESRGRDSVRSNLRSG